MSQVNELIQHLKRKLRGAGLTYKDLADRIGVSESTLKRWFSQGSFAVERLDDICRALAIDLADVLPGRRGKRKEFHRTGVSGRRSGLPR